MKIENSILYKVYNSDIKNGTVTIPKSVTKIGRYAFSSCNSLTNITITNSVTRIFGYAFFGCTSLTSIIIPNSVTRIGKYAFSDCTLLTSINVSKDNSQYSSVNGVLFNKDKTVLIQYPIGENNTSYEIPNSIKRIEDSAFFGCTSLTSIIIPNSVTEIGTFAFYGCNSLTSITISNGVTRIGRYAFCNTFLKTQKANYKAFVLTKEEKMKCKNYIFEINEWSEEINEIEPSERGYHYCTNLFEIFNYYSGELDREIALYICEVGDKVVTTDLSKCVTDKIKPVKRLSRADVIRILNGQE